MRFRSERQTLPRKAALRLSERTLEPGRQAEEGSEGVWHAEERDEGSASGWRTRIASQPLMPREAVMCPLRTGKGRRRGIRAGRTGLFDLHFEALVTQQLHAGSAMLPATPIAPEQGSRGHH